MQLPLLSESDRLSPSCPWFARRLLDDSQLAHPVLIESQRRIFDRRVNPLLLFVVEIAMEKNNLLAQKQFFSKSGLGSVIVDKSLALAGFAFERFDNLADHPPILQADDSIDDLCLSHSHVGHNR